MSESQRRHLARISEPVRELLCLTPDVRPEGSNVSIKSVLESCLPGDGISITDFTLCCAGLVSAGCSSHAAFSWVSEPLRVAAGSAFRDFSAVFSTTFEWKKSRGFTEFGFDYGSISEEKWLLLEVTPVLLPLLKSRIKESSMDASGDGGEILAASARVPVVHAVLAAHQFRWLVTQIGSNELAKLAFLVIPSALTALDHWSPEVKGQGMISFIHLGKHVDAGHMGGYGDVILDACCQNIASSSDETWNLVVEMVVLLVTRMHHGNPRSAWFEKTMNEMLAHLERQPTNEKRRIAWLEHIQPLLREMGLVLLAHFRHLFPLFFQWIHAHDNQTVLLTLNKISAVLELTWICNSPFMIQLVDELVLLYKEAAMRSDREEIRSSILHIFTYLRSKKDRLFNAAWKKHVDDPNLTSLGESLAARSHDS